LVKTPNTHLRILGVLGVNVSPSWSNIIRVNYPKMEVYYISQG